MNVHQLGNARIQHESQQNFEILVNIILIQSWRNGNIIAKRLKLKSCVDAITEIMNEKWQACLAIVFNFVCGQW